MRALICGSRAPKFTGPNKKSISDKLHRELFYELEAYVFQNGINGISEIVEGGASGGDRAGKQLASHLSLKPTTFPADWTMFGKQAGHIRNQEMADYCTKDDVVIALWDMESRGTEGMIKIAKKKMKVYVVDCSKIFEKYRKMVNS